jgi:hypothetical protein
LRIGDLRSQIGDTLGIRHGVIFHEEVKKIEHSCECSIGNCTGLLAE